MIGFSTVSATPLTPEEALARVYSSSGPARLVSNNTLRLSKTFTSKSHDEATVYAFSQGPDNGFILVSADADVTPLLGYSDTGTFDADNLPPAFLYWIEEYGNQIEYMRENRQNYQSAATRRHLPEDTPKIPALLKTSWDQNL